MKISIVIPCRNEKKYIEKCINAIYENTVLQIGEIEVFVIDGMSDDGTIEILHNLKNKFYSLEIISNPKKVTPVAFNLGIQASTGDFIQIIGARQIIDSNYLKNAVNTFQNNPKIWCVGGQVENIYENQTSRSIANAMNTPFGVGMGNFRILKESAFTDTVGTPMYPKFVFEKLGLFDESLVRNQDDDFNYRVLKGGGLIYLNTEMTLQYYVRAAFRNLYKQYFQYGYWKVYVNKKHKSVTTLRQLIPPLWMLFLIIVLPLTFLHPYILHFYLGTIALYLLIGISFSISKSKFHWSFIQIWFSFFLLHFGYGLGYLKGMFDFFILNRKPTQNSKSLSR